MKKESSFKLRSGNDLGKSATKLMSQSPTKKTDDNIPALTASSTVRGEKFYKKHGAKGYQATYHRALDPLRGAIQDQSELSASQKFGIKKTKLENKIKGFFGNIRQGFNKARRANKARAKERTKKLQKFFIPKKK